MARETALALTLTVALMFASAVLPAAAEEVSYESGGRRDPFVPLVGAEGILLKEINLSEFHLEGIVYDPSKGSLALINGEFYRAGDQVKGATLQTIAKDHVVLAQEDKDVTLWVSALDNEKEDRLL